MKNEKFIEGRFFLALRFLWISAAELYKGVTNDMIPVWRYCFPGIFIGYALLFGLDTFLAKVTGLDWFEFGYYTKKFLILWFASAGWILWAMQRAYQRVKLLSRLKVAFDDCNLKIGNAYPSFIEDIALDDDVRKMKLFLPGLTLARFESVKESLEAHWNINIVKMYTEDNDKSRLNIVYATKDFPKEILAENLDRYSDGVVPIGRTYTGEITVCVKEMPHMLVAGQSGCGKSNFVKMMVSILCRNNPESEVCYMDFKNGAELEILKSHLGTKQPNFTFQNSQQEALEYLAGLDMTLSSRLEAMKEIGVANFDDYLKKYEATSVQGSKIRRDEKLKRLYLVIDEVAEIYTRSRDKMTPAHNLAKQALNRIARQGRAAGVHIVATTQKPDSVEIDQSVKANMPAILCFPMTTAAASVAALGTKRAFDLNVVHKGRAIYKFGPSLTEVQTYLFNY